MTETLVQSEAAIAPELALDGGIGHTALAITCDRASGCNMKPKCVSSCAAQFAPGEPQLQLTTTVEVPSPQPPAA